jgi:hypothetical protein
MLKCLPTGNYVSYEVYYLTAVTEEGCTLKSDAV